MSHQIKKLLKVNVRVKELRPALDFFGAAFGAKLIEDRGGATIGDFDGATMDLGGAVFDFVAPNKPGSTLAKNIEQRGQGIDSVAFEVESLDDTQAALKTHGIDVINRTEIRGNQVGFVHPKNAFGILIELIERPK